MGVKYVIVEPDPPGPRWKTTAVIIGAILLVAYLQGQDGAADHQKPRPTPSPSVSRSATP